MACVGSPFLQCSGFGSSLDQDGLVGADLDGHAAAAADAPAIEDAAATPVLDDDVMGDAGGPAPDGEAAAVGPQGGQGADAAARDQHRWRRATLEWNRSGTVFGDAFAMSVAMEPRVQIMRRKLHIGGDGWEKDQCKKVHDARRAHREASGGHPTTAEVPGLAQLRDFRLPLAWAGTLESEFASSNNKIMDDAFAWEPLPA
eukprot:6442331-Pyramimonas_sp.AAC.1